MFFFRNVFLTMKVFFEAIVHIIHSLCMHAYVGKKTNYSEIILFISASAHNCHCATYDLMQQSKTIIYNSPGPSNLFKADIPEDRRCKAEV